MRIPPFAIVSSAVPTDLDPALDGSEGYDKLLASEADRGAPRVGDQGIDINYYRIGRYGAYGLSSVNYRALDNLRYCDILRYGPGMHCRCLWHRVWRLWQ